MTASGQPSGRRASNRSARTNSVVAVGNYQAPDVVALRLKMLLMLGADNVSVAFLLDGCNCWRTWHCADTLNRFSDDLLD
jgi:hypothetical protein